MKAGDKLEVKSSHLEFDVTGTDNSSISRGTIIPFSDSTSKWSEALKWLKELQQSDGDPHLVVNKVTRFKNSEAVSMEELFAADWKDLDMDAVVEKRIEELKEQITQAEKELHDLAFNKRSIDRKYLKLGRILYRHDQIEDPVIIG